MNTQKFNSNPFQIDKEQVLRHLEYLGYEYNDRVYLRFFYHSKDPRKSGDKGRKLDRLDLNKIECYQQDGRGVYLVVNGAGGGHQNEDIKRCIAIFCEWDDRPIEEQMQLWDAVGFFEPTFIIYSGDRSLQPYWVFEEPLNDVQQWREIQVLLIEVMGADLANKNPSRVFRLAGGFHIKPGREPVQTEIVADSGRKYTPEQLVERLREIKQRQQPQSEQPALLPQKSAAPHQSLKQRLNRYADITLPIPAAVPLEVCLSKASRNLLTESVPESGGPDGGRDVSGAKLARDLIGTANYFQSINQQYDGDPKQLFDDYANRCSPALDSEEIAKIWNSAIKSCPTPSCKEDGVENCVKAWYWKNYVKPKQTAGNRISNQTYLSKEKRSDSREGDPDSIAKAVSIDDRIREILNSNLSSSKQEAAFVELASSTGRQVREIKQLAEAIESEADLTEGRADRVSELNQLIKIGDRRLTLSRYLHPHLALPLQQIASWMGVDPEALLTVLLPTAASLLHPETRVIVKKSIDFLEPLVIYAGIVSESGNRKSPTFNIIIKPLRRLQDEEEVRNKLAQEKYRVEQLAWKQNNSEDKGDPPEPPGPPREYFVDNITSEALDRIKAQQPGHGLLIRKDELSGLFGSYGAYKGGKGSDREGILSGWNGQGIKVNRASGSRLSLSHDASSIVGAIQPGKLRQLLGNLEDEQGEWARFLWYFSPLRTFRLPDNDTSFQVGDLLEGIYRKLDKLPPTQYRFTSEAQRLYDNWHWQLEQRKLAEPRQGMRAAIAKMQGYTARITGILHMLWVTAAGESLEPDIPIERIKAAQQLAEFYLGQVKLIHSDADAAQGELTPLLKQILEKAQQLGQLSTRIAKTSIRTLRSVKTDKILELFRELEAMGYARLEGKTLIPQNVDNVDKVLTSPSAAKTIDNRLLQPITARNVDCVDDVDRFLEQEQNQTVEEQQLVNPLLTEVEPEQPSTLNSNQPRQHVNNFALGLTQQSVDCADKSSTPASTFSNKSPRDLAAQILQCQTWVAIVEEIDAVSAIRKSTRDMVFEIVVTKCLNEEDRQHLVYLLANHIQQFPQDNSAYNWLPQSCQQLKDEANTLAQNSKGGIG